MPETSPLPSVLDTDDSVSPVSGPLCPEGVVGVGPTHRATPTPENVLDDGTFLSKF